MRMGKKWIMILGIALALIVDTLLTYRLARTEPVRAASAPTLAAENEDPIDRFRLEREQLRARQEAQLNEIIHDSRTDAQTVAVAQRQLSDLIQRAEKEVTLEGVLQARGFEDALVTVSDHSANVLIRRETLAQRETAVILELVLRETGLTGGNVKIIPVK